MSPCQCKMMGEEPACLHTGKNHRHFANHRAFSQESPGEFGFQTNFSRIRTQNVENCERPKDETCNTLSAGPHLEEIINALDIQQCNNR